MGDVIPGPLPAPPPLTPFNKLVTILAYLYLLRMPILTGLVLVAFPFAALWHGSPVSSLLQNLFLLTPLGTFWSTVAALVLSWSVLLTSRLVLLNGEERFDLPQAMLSINLRARSVFGIMLLALPTILGPFTQKSDFGFTDVDLKSRAAAMVLGILFAYVFAFLALLVAVLFAPMGTQTAAETFPALAFMRRLLRRADRYHGFFQAWVSRLCRWLRGHLSPSLWQGYLNPADGLLWGGHWLALTFAFATALLYFGLNLYRRAFLGEPSPVSALAFVLLLLLNMNWVLASVAFLLDRYRVPLIAPIVILCVAGAQPPSSDHYYSVQRGVLIEPIRPEEVLDARFKQNKPIVVIATAGGGIQAATWTAQVLAGLEEQSRIWKTPSFADSVALISSVSGGATGAMFYLNLYHPDRGVRFDEEGLKRLTQVTSESSLDDIAWAMVYRDFPRIFFPYMNRSSEDKLLDRGYMLEESWRNRGNIQANLSNWRLGVKQGHRPATIFNSTIAETGEPMVFATSDLNPSDEAIHRRSFYELYPNTDLPVVTAVRLAATFPYVTPAARALSTKPEYHMIDGGYYDNYGISSLIAWLDEAFHCLQNAGKPLPDLLVIQILSFPDDALNPPTNRGWFFQAYAPLEGLLSVRTTAQLVRDREELALFAQRWAKTPHQGSTAERIQFASFQFNGQNAPLSWSMNAEQKAEIRRKWGEFATPTNLDLLAVHCFFDPAQPDCSKLSKKGPW